MRRCIFCKLDKSNLSRHILLAHKTEERVKSIIDKFDKKEITSTEKKRALEAFRKEGILSQNREIMSQGTGAQLKGERISYVTEMVLCSTCDGFYATKAFYKHKKRCGGKACHAVSTSGKEEGKDKDWREISSGMRRDPLFDVISQDKAIRKIGAAIWLAKKPNKHKEAMSNARQAMRRLARLKVASPNCASIPDLFRIRKLSTLEAAINTMSEEEGEKTKAGLKIALSNLVKLSAKTLIMMAQIDEDKKEVEELKGFLETFSMPLYYNKVFAAAEYQLKEKRHRENRKPDKLPLDKDINILRAHLEEEIDTLVESGVTDASQFIRLRRATLSFLTLMYGRRGSEVARMTLADWEERESWVNQKDLSPADKKLLEKYSVVFLMGKGTNMIDIIFNERTSAAAACLADSKVRQHATVGKENRYLFPYTDGSMECCVGYNEIARICQQLDIEIITATSMRHSLSTKFWQLPDVSPETRRLFMEHLGHAEGINKHVYACQPAVRVLREVAPMLDNFFAVSILLSLYTFDMPF